MKISTNLVVDSLLDIENPAKKIENLGFESLYISERKHEPFMQLAIASTVTNHIKIGSEIALAFPRNPMILAYTSWDLQNASKGRFILGLGTQVKAHNERRFGIPWESPGPKLKEYILAIKAIWDCWQNNKDLNFEGEFFKFNLMTPMFNPGPINVPEPPIFIGAVNPWNCKMAGEIADGFHCHGFHTSKSLKEQVITNIEEGLKKTKRSRKDFIITAPVMAIMGDNKKEIDKMREKVRSMIAFYGSTSFYKKMFKSHNWENTFNKLIYKSRNKQWDSMAKEITDDMIEEIAVTGFYNDIPNLLKKKYGNMIDEILIYFGEPEKGNPDLWKKLIKSFSNTNP